VSRRRANPDYIKGFPANSMFSASINRNLESTFRSCANFLAISNCTGLIVIPNVAARKFSASQIELPPIPQPTSRILAPGLFRPFPQAMQSSYPGLAAWFLSRYIITVMDVSPIYF